MVGGFKVGHAVLKVVTCKVTKHEKSYMKNQHIFISIAFDTFGFLTPNVVELLNKIQRIIYNNVMSSKSIDIVFKIICFIIKKSLTV